MPLSAATARPGRRRRGLHPAHGVQGKFAGFSCRHCRVVVPGGAAAIGVLCAASLVSHVFSYCRRCQCCRCWPGQTPFLWRTSLSSERLPPHNFTVRPLKICADISLQRIRLNSAMVLLVCQDSRSYGVANTPPQATLDRQGLSVGHREQSPAHWRQSQAAVATAAGPAPSTRWTSLRRKDRARTEIHTSRQRSEGHSLSLRPCWRLPASGAQFTCCMAPQKCFPSSAAGSAPSGARHTTRHLTLELLRTFLLLILPTCSDVVPPLHLV